MTISRIFLFGRAGLLAALLGLSLSAQPTTARLVNIATRGQVGKDANLLIGGFVIGGAAKTVLVRAVGPGLATFGVAGTLPDPQLEIVDAKGATVARNDNWAATDLAAMTSSGAFPLAAGSKDAVIVATLPPGAYSAKVSGVGTVDTGVAIIEVYDISIGGQIVNLATRLQVGTGANAAFAGFVVAPGSGTRKLLIRGIGPALAGFGVPGTLPDPKLALLDGSQTTLGTAVANGGLSVLAQAATQAGAFASAGSDAVMLATLAPGNYTAQVSGASGTSNGVALVEVYDLSGSSDPTPVALTAAATATALEIGGSRTFTTSLGAPVTWSVVEPGGGSITAAGVYTAPATPGTFTIKASVQGTTQTGTTGVVIPVGSVAGYDVGVDYHATGSDYDATSFLERYHVPTVRQLVQTQLQGMADRGATVISTRMWFLRDPGENDFSQYWRATFPISDQESANLRAYAQDVAAVRGAGGNRLRLDLCFLWLGRADYLTGTPATGLGYFKDTTAANFTAHVEQTTDRVLAAVSDILRPDGKPVVDTVYLDGEVMIGYKANQDWFLTTHYPRFVAKVTAAGLHPSVYFIVNDTQDHLLQNDYTDANFPVLNNHRSMFFVYRTLKFMKDNGLFIPPRIDFSYYVKSAGAPASQVLTRVLNDADATLPSIGAPRFYGASESYYFLDAYQRRQAGQAFALEAVNHARLQRVCFWTTPYNDGTPGVTAAYPFAFEDYLPPLIVK